MSGHVGLHCGEFIGWDRLSMDFKGFSGPTWRPLMYVAKRGLYAKVYVCRGRFPWYALEHDQKQFTFVNVYSSCSIEGKQRLWADLCMSKRGFGGELWCVGGDFNAITDALERKGRSAPNGRCEQAEFFGFIQHMQLVDLPVMGKKFTWFSTDGSSMSRLDRFLISERLVRLWGITCQWVGRREVSGHYVISLRSDVKEWGPKPFKFFNCWLDSPGFASMIAGWWKKINVEGRKSYVLKEKMKLLKQKLRVWNKDVFNRLVTGVDEKLEELDGMDLKLCDDVFVDSNE